MRAAATRQQEGQPIPIPPSVSLGDTSIAMIIRTGHAQVRVDDVQQAVTTVRQLASQLGGYVANTSYQGGRDQIRSATLELKIPAARYEQAVAQLDRIGEVESVNTTAEDVGEEYVDLTARVANARRLEQRLTQLLASRTGTLEHVLTVERELARVRGEIEQIEGRLRYLRTRAAMSTLVVTVHEPEPLHGRLGQNPIIEALRRAWRNFVEFIAAIIASLGVVIPLGLIGLAGWYGYRRWRARYRTRV
jgi:aminopeptidase N